jgi:hypothetical protein
MIIVRTPDGTLFNYTECEELYNKNRELVGDDSFDDVIKRTDFYSFIIWQNNELLGCIYYYKRDDGRTYVNAFAERGHHELNLECFKESLRRRKEKAIYAETKHRTAAICLYRVGFKKIGENLYEYRRK